MRYLTMALCVSMLAGCADHQTAKPIVAPCDAPQIIPKGGLTGKRAAILWNRDRENLRVCGARLASVAG